MTLYLIILLLVELMATTAKGSFNRTLITHPPNYKMERCSHGRGLMLYMTAEIAYKNKLPEKVVGTWVENFIPYRMCLFQNITPIWTQHYLSTSEKKDICIRKSLIMIVVTQRTKGRLFLIPLTPECDFSNPYIQVMARLQSSSAVQLKRVAYGNWLKLETALQNYVNTGPPKELKIYTGYLGRQTIQDNIVIPLVFFKVVTFSPTNTTVYVGQNQITDDPEYICNWVITGCGWPEVEQGKIYCCMLDEDLQYTLGIDID